MSDTLKNQVFTNLEIAMAELNGVHTYLIEENRGGRQFDYVTNPKLSDKVDELVNKVEKIRQIVYQESKWKSHFIES